MVSVRTASETDVCACFTRAFVCDLCAARNKHQLVANAHFTRNTVDLRNVLIWFSQVQQMCTFG